MVANIIPPTTVTPMAIRLSAPAPAPVATAIGKMPKTVLKLVIKIGRKRDCAASRIACRKATREKRFGNGDEEN